MCGKGAIIAVFLPECVNKDAVLGRVVEELSLSVDHVPEGSPFEFSAQLRDQGAYLLIEYDSNVAEIVSEMSEWQMPTKEYKLLLTNCRSSIIIHYRGIEHARNCLKAISDTVGGISTKCIIENGEGCLLRLSDVMGKIAGDPTWTWEREEFPEIYDVAPSEWRSG
jgi:hypothetical protein